MIYIVHGEDSSKSRTQIVNQIKKLGDVEKKELTISGNTPEQIGEILKSRSLFGNPTVVVIDITGSGRTNYEPFIEAIKQTPEETTLIIYSSKGLQKSNLFIKNIDVLKAKEINNKIIPQGDIFRFVETLFSKNRQKTYIELNKLMEDGTDNFYIFSMILYGIRKNIQSNKLNVEILEKIYGIDKGIKTGEIPQDMMLTLAVELVLNS